MNESIYQAWHRNLGHGEYRVSMTMAGYGNDDDAAVDLLNGHLRTHEDLGPVVSQNSSEDTITITLGLRAKDEENAVHLAGEAWVSGGIASGLEPGDVIRIGVERVADPEVVDCDDRGRVYA